MTHVRTSFLPVGLIAWSALALGSVLAQTLPAWVTAEKEPLKMRRSTPPSYLEVTHMATIARPKALTKPEELEKLNPGLLQAMPALRDLLGTATESPKFKKLYDTKIDSVAGGNIMLEHQFFDCATVLNLKNEASGRRAILFQADMDTDTDGTDPVRLSQLKEYDDARFSRSFQPLLSYSWNKSAAEKAENPFLKYHEQTLEKLRGLQKQVDGFAQGDVGSVWQDMKKHLDDQASSLDRRAKYYRSDLMFRRSLIASKDPFIVIPQTWLDEQMMVGDFAAVIYGGKVYPCLIGDTGPTTKTGEGSTRLCKALNPKASGRVSAVSTPGVTYIVFPGTRTAKGVPDFTRYQSELQRLLGELGGLGEGVKVHLWD